jgi:tRNA(Ile)-lysidine synthase
MINILGTIPRKVTLAFSGGVDSVAAADFLRRNHCIKLLFVHHGTETSEQALALAKRYATEWGVPLQTHFITATKQKCESQEEFWRNERYAIFEQTPGEVITCHHLDDCVETWIWSSLHGCGKLIPTSRANIIRPFLSTRKQSFVQWCNKRSLTWAEDKSNADTSFIRNYIRHELLPHALRVNPGIHKTIRKKVLANV